MLPRNQQIRAPAQLEMEEELSVGHRLQHPGGVEVLRLHFQPAELLPLREQFCDLLLLLEIHFVDEDDREDEALVVWVGLFQEENHVVKRVGERRPASFWLVKADSARVDAVFARVAVAHRFWCKLGLNIGVLSLIRRSRTLSKYN